MKTNPTETQEMRDRSLVHVAGVTLAICSLAGVGFFGAYAIAGSLYPPQEQQQTTAAVVAIEKPDPFASVTLIAKSAYVVDLTTGKILYQLNPNIQLPLASLTKVALVLSVNSALPPNTLVSTPAQYPNPPLGGTMRLPAGKTWDLADVIDFTLAASSDDGAQLLAEAANGAIESQYPDAPQDGADTATLWRMNDLSQQLGLTNTYFLNVTGLDLSPTQSGAYGSARDVAEMFAYAASTSPQTFAATSKQSVTVSATDGTKATGTNTDVALDAIPGLLMGKTGYTDLAGGNLGVIFEAAPGHPVVAIVMGSTEDGRFSDMKQLVPAAQAAVAEGK
jgi:D-alanyl-D-alanine carboxypeptidase (penicillin-binding protein 5/6)